MSEPDIVDPRVTRTRKAVAAAVAALLTEEGVGAITHQRVAERSGVGRATLYRHWPTPVDLLLDALANLDEPFLRHGEGPLRQWLLRELRRAADMMAHPLSTQVLLAIIGSARFDTMAANLRERLLIKSVAPLADALKRGVASGELAVAPNPVELVAELVGPLLFRRTLQDLPVGRAMIERIVDNALAPYLPISTDRVAPSRPPGNRRPSTAARSRYARSR